MRAYAVHRRPYVAALECIEALAPGAIDIALIAIRMPRMDGIQLAHHLARLPQPPAVIFALAWRSAEQETPMPTGRLAP